MLQQATFLLDGNAHIDAAWLWPWTETVDVVKRTFGTALQLMNEYPGYTFTQSAAAYNEWMAQKYPALNDEIKQRIKEGRWEIVGGMWVEPDLNMPDGESLVRQLLVGKRWYKQAYGVDVRIGWNPDSFGYTWQLPQIYKKSGIDYFVTQKMTWNDTNKLPFKLFWWESPDGSKVLTYFPHDYVNLNLSPVRLSDDLATARKRSPGLTEMMDLYGVGDHGGGPTRAILDEGFHWKRHATDHGDAEVPVRHGAELFLDGREADRAGEPGVELPVDCEGLRAAGGGAGQGVDSDLGYGVVSRVPSRRLHHAGQPQEKHARQRGRGAERGEVFLACLGPGRTGISCRTRSTEDWKKVLFNQFHDLAAGSGIGVIYKDAQKDYDWVRMSTQEISSGALETVSENIEHKMAQATPILVYNPLGWVRSGLCARQGPISKGKPRMTIWGQPGVCDLRSVQRLIQQQASLILPSGSIEFPHWATRLFTLGSRRREVPGSRLRASERTWVVPSRSTIVI